LIRNSLLVAALCAPAALRAEAKAAIALAGDLPKTAPLSLEELKGLGATPAVWTAHGVAHRVLGVRLDRVLAARGFTAGKMGKDVPKAEKRAGYRKVALLTAADGYQAVLSCAEISEAMGPTVAMLVWELDGAPLDAEQGPVRLVVLTDQEPSRSIYAVRRIEVVDVPALAAARR
jgi:fermentation-respiration switch protein FrsA (DUF1100 family)